MNQITRILRTELSGFYTSIIKHVGGLYDGLYEVGITTPQGNGNEDGWNITIHDTYEDAYLMARVYAATFALYLEDENPQRLADEKESLSDIQLAAKSFKGFSVKPAMIYHIPREAVLTFPEGMPHNRRWVDEWVVMDAARKTCMSENCKTQKFLRAVSDWVFDPSDWKAPVRINASLLGEFEISWVKAVIIWYHGVESIVQGQFITSSGYGC
jgi:hypothetical protein